jgi:hypothetical protein
MAWTTLPLPDPLLAPNGAPITTGVRTQDDALAFKVSEAPRPGVGPCQIEIVLETFAGDAERGIPAVTWGKKVVAWSAQLGDVDSIERHDNIHGPVSMLLDRNFDELHLYKLVFGGRWWDEYELNMDELWQFCSGRSLTITWMDDRHQHNLDSSGNWVDLPPPPYAYSYPFFGEVETVDGVFRHLVDGTVLQTPAAPRFALGPDGWLTLPPRPSGQHYRPGEEPIVAWVVYGGARFAIRDNPEGLEVARRTSWLMLNPAIVEQATIDNVPTSPLDFTTLQADVPIDPGPEMVEIAEPSAVAVAVTGKAPWHPPEAAPPPTETRTCVVFGGRGFELNGPGFDWKGPSHDWADNYGNQLPPGWTSPTFARAGLNVPWPGLISAEDYLRVIGSPIREGTLIMEIPAVDPTAPNQDPEPIRRMENGQLFALTPFQVAVECVDIRNVRAVPYWALP